MSGLDKGLAIGNILVQGFAALKGNNAKPVDPNAKTVDSFCFKNKMDEKITVKLNGKIEDEEIKKNSLSQKTKKNVRTTFQKVFILMKFCFQVRILIKKENIKFTKKL
ncbi:Uncharacterised protein [Chryseobacterium taihuense]|uniref:Uncharacterized protein n=2 Tax=Chryseobacterium taihuense TaxID=1141221 RepID=A0A4U8WG22_9FLAO|nr:Uncharacterised protein [Chryseobacterium taihuense]